MKEAQNRQKAWTGGFIRTWWGLGFCTLNCQNLIAFSKKFDTLPVKALN